MVDQDQTDTGDGMQCSEHPYTKNPGGICAFCLQEKLGKLVSSSFPLSKQKQASSSSSPTSPPSFRSASIPSSCAAAAPILPSIFSSASLSFSLSVPKASSRDAANGYSCNTVRATKLPFLLTRKKKKKMVASSSATDRSADIVFKRSKSTVTPRTAYGEGFSPRKRGGFWSFLYHSHSKSHRQNSDSASDAQSRKVEAKPSQGAVTAPNASSLPKRVVAEDNSGISLDDVSCNAPAFERRVSRSRSVGCGSRSFSGDFFERISTGLGDCTLRRVESQREGKPKISNTHSPCHSGNNNAMKEMVKCGGIFGGFMILTSSSSSSSSATSSSYWVSSSADHRLHGGAGAGALVHGRHRSWGWAFASPIRAFSSSKASSKDGKREHVIRETSPNNTTTPNLDAIPSLLAARS